MSYIPNNDEAQYLDDPCPALTSAKQRQRAQAINPNPAYKPPQRERLPSSIYDIPDLNNEQQKPRSKNERRAPTVPSTPLRLSQTNTPPNSKKNRPLQAKNIKELPKPTVSKPNFQQNCGHSSSSKATSNVFVGASPATTHTTTMQSGIAMTTMQKLAAFRYQPSSTGSIHKAVAPIAAASSQDALISIVAVPCAATIFPAGRKAHTLGNVSYQRASHPKSLTPMKAARYGKYGKDLSQAIEDIYPAAGIHEPGLDMLLPQMDAASTHMLEHKDLPSAGSDHRHIEPLSLRAPIFETLHATESSRARTESKILLDTDLSNQGHTKGQSELRFDEWNVEYGGKLQSDHIPSLETVHGQQQKYVSLPPDMEAQPVDLPGHTVSNVLEINPHSGQTDSPADDEMLNYGVFDTLTAESWNHRDSAAITDGQYIIRTNHAIQTEHGRCDNLDEGNEFVPGDSMTSEVNLESHVGQFVGDVNPVHSHDQMPNSEFPPSRMDFADTRVHNAEPAQDDFAALEELDDHDFENAEIHSRGIRNENKTTRSCEVPIKQGWGLAEEDYLAAFKDFTDDDFKNVEILNEHTGNGRLLRDQKISANSSHVLQVPETQPEAQPLKNNGLDSILHKLASRASSPPQESRDDDNGSEYPLDEDEQAELNEARILTHQAVHETREPPSSILRSEEDMRDMDMYDKTLKYSPIATSCVLQMPEGNNVYYRELHEPLTDPEDWEFLRRPRGPHRSNTAPSPALYTSDDANDREHSSGIPNQAEGDDYSPLHPFARPPFPAAKVAARSPVNGLSSNMLLRTCFRIGEALSQASLCSRDNQDALTELFARVTFSSREVDGKNQNFQFGDIFHNKPPFISGVLEKYSSSDLQKTESFELITVDKERSEDEPGQMVRVLGRVKRVIQGRGYSINIVNIRKTDWEEVRWTQRILSLLGT